MKFQLRNIGALEKADIDLDGITIIAGENNVGKSTVGKALYAFLYEMGTWKDQYDDICSTRIEDFLYKNSVTLEDWCMRVSGAKRRRTTKADQLQNKYAQDEGFVVAIEDFQVTGDADGQARDALKGFLSEYCKEYLSLYMRNQKNVLRQDLDEQSDWVDHWIDQAIDGMQSLELDELKIQLSEIKKSFQNTFDSQYRKIGTSESQILFTDDSGREVRFTVGNAGEELSQPVRVEQSVYIIESPKIYDYLSNTRAGHVQKEYLRYLMSPNIFKNNPYMSRFYRSEFQTIKMESEATALDIARELEETMGGRAEFLQKVGLEFKDRHIPEPIHSVNVSTGLKSMALLEYALRIGAIEEGDILILDEPEINLHPEWQVEYARALVSLQKDFHLKILITTHSPYFMRAIECYADKENCMDQLNVYRMDKNPKSGTVQVENVSYSEYGMTDLYDALTAPLEELEKMLDEKYGTDERHEHIG